MSASSRLGLNIDQYRIDEARDFENFEDDDFPALRLNHDLRKAQHMVTGHKASQNSVLEFLTGLKT